jgi:uncharacterized protein
MRGSDRFIKLLLLIGIIGAINWGLIGFLNFNLVDAIFGGGSREQTSGFARLIYAVVGLSGLVALFSLPRLRLLDRHSTTAAGTRVP